MDFRRLCSKAKMDGNAPTFWRMLLWCFGELRSADAFGAVSVPCCRKQKGTVEGSVHYTILLYESLEEEAF